jgi:hypothetical protein
MGDRTPKDSSGVNHHYKCAWKSRAKKPASESSFIQRQNDDYSNDMQKGKGNGITTGLPPGESFTFIVREQDCLHTFED